MTWKDIADNTPATMADWNTAIESSGLHVKWDEQLREIKDMAVVGLDTLNRDLAKAQASSTSEYKEYQDGTFGVVSRADDRTEEIEILENRIVRKRSVIELCWQEARVRKALRKQGKVFPETPDKYKRTDEVLDVEDDDDLPIPPPVDRNPVGTTYYIDTDNGSDAADGLSTGNAWQFLKKYLEDTVRSVGDIAILRRGMTGIYSASDAVVSQDESGTLLNMITAEADFDNAFSDDVDLSVTATATIAFGSKTITYSSDISGVLAAGDWIYEVNDDQREFSYEVKTVSTVTVTLYLPYKGGNAGSGKATTNMQANPVWGTTSYTTGFLQQASFSKYQGITVRSNDGSFVLTGSSGCIIKDCVTTGGSSSTNDGLRMTGNSGLLLKCRSESVDEALSTAIQVVAKDCLLDANSSGGVVLASVGAGDIIDCTNAVGAYISDDSSGASRLRNCSFTGGTADYNISSATGNTLFKHEDFGQTSLSTKVIDISFEDGVMTSAVYILESDTGTVRSGGNNTSIKVTPTAAMTAAHELGFVQVVELSIYASTSSKTYTMYVKSNATANWTADPTAAELVLEFEAWGDAGATARLITKSSSVADFNGTTDWIALAVTVAPAAAGVGYLRLRYGKTKESGKSNVFFVDPLVVVS